MFVKSFCVREAKSKPASRTGNQPFASAVSLTNSRSNLYEHFINLLPLFYILFRNIFLSGRRTAILITGDWYFEEKKWTAHILLQTLPIQTHSTKVENQNWTRYDALIAWTAGGGLTFILLGFFSLAVFTLFEGNNTALNYAGVVSLIAGFIFFGVTAHFMDQRDASERQQKRAEFENLTKNNFLYESVTFSDAGSGEADRFEVR